MSTMIANTRPSRVTRVPIRKPVVVNNAKRKALGNISNLSCTATTLGGKVSQRTKSVQIYVPQKAKTVQSPLPVASSQEPTNVEYHCETTPIPHNITNIDCGEPDPLLCKEYAVDVFRYLRQLELSFSLREDFMSEQHESTYKQRAILIDWLNQVHMEFLFISETFHLAVSIMDLFLQIKEVPQRMFPLLGITALFIAAKYEETTANLDVRDFVYIMNISLYNTKDVLRMEMRILKALNFRVGRPLALTFLRRYTLVGNSDVKAHNLARYYLELSLQYHKSACLRPSLLAAAASYLSSKTVDQSFYWNSDLECYSGYSAAELAPATNLLVGVVIKARQSSLQAVTKKYASAVYFWASSLPELSVVPTLTF